VTGQVSQTVEGLVLTSKSDSLQVRGRVARIYSVEEGPYGSIGLSFVCRARSPPRGRGIVLGAAVRMRLRRERTR
jgi:hypothetical protein